MRTLDKSFSGTSMRHRSGVKSEIRKSVVAWCHVLGELDVAGHHQGVEGRSDLGVGELDLCALELRLGRAQLGQRGVVGLLADQTLVPRFLGAVEGQLRLVAGDGGDRDLVLRLALVDAGHAAGRHGSSGPPRY